MEKTTPANGQKHIVMGILAHVDAGKTTLSEYLLTLAGVLRAPGRVDDGSTALDTDPLEKERGITIYASEASFDCAGARFTLLDTPGHVDFSPEAERIIPVLDLAVLLISGTDGVQAHTETLWQLLAHYHVPTVIFVSKMDRPDTDRAALMRRIRERLGEECVDFTDDPDAEEIALCGEDVLERFLESGSVSDEDITQLVASRRLFPCFFGSGLAQTGADRMLKELARWAPESVFGEAFGARVYRISRDPSGARLTHVRLTGGSLSAREELVYHAAGGERREKVTQIRLYTGAQFEQTDCVYAGETAALTGLSSTYPGQVLGAGGQSRPPVLAPSLSYALRLPPEVSPYEAMPRLRELAEEEPTFSLHWQEDTGEIRFSLMGEIQIQVLTELIRRRFGWEVTFDEGRILYRETIAAPSYGVGHFEPLRHYAEVLLMLTPLPAGSGIELDTRCPEDKLERNWQRLILSNLADKQHVGVLTGAPLTDVRITLIAGRAHEKHTEGGDFRQAACRAVRQGLMEAENVLLEPCYSYSLRVPAAQLGRAAGDIRAMHGTVSAPEAEGEMMRLTGKAPVSGMRDYSRTLAAYTGGRGSLSLTPGGYEPAYNAQEIIREIGYEPERDTDNPPDSVFCAHGAGFTVKWNQVRDYMHVTPGDLRPAGKEESIVRRPSAGGAFAEDKELQELMDREFGEIRRPVYGTKRTVSAQPEWKPAPKLPEYYLIDGYNLIYAWDELTATAKEDLSAAREILKEILADFKGYTGCEALLVFDGYRVKGSRGSEEDYLGVHVVYTAEGETGDTYIEKSIAKIGKNYHVNAVTSDSLIQIFALRKGVLRMSSREFIERITAVCSEREFELARRRMREREGYYPFRDHNLPGEIPEKEEKEKNDDQSQN